MKATGDDDSPDGGLAELLERHPKPVWWRERGQNGVELRVEVRRAAQGSGGRSPWCVCIRNRRIRAAAGSLSRTEAIMLARGAGFALLDEDLLEDLERAVR